MKDYGIADQRYGRSWTEHAKIETSQRTRNQGTVEGMDDRPSASRMSERQNWVWRGGERAVQRGGTKLGKPQKALPA
jgi:hypothetical protein